MCSSRAEADRALERLTVLLGDLGLAPKADKTRIVHLTERGEGFDFLGFHHRLVRARGRTGTKRFVFLARWPSRRAAQHARDRLRVLTVRSRLLVPVEEVVGSLNRFLRGWAGYFRIGNSAWLFDRIRSFAVHATRHLRWQPPPAVSVAGDCTSVLPSPGMPWPGQPQWTRRRTQAELCLAGPCCRTPPVKGVGEPCAGEPHARFDGGELEKECCYGSRSRRPSGNRGT